MLTIKTCRLTKTIQIHNAYVSVITCVRSVRFTKACLAKLKYNERLSVLGLQTLETRRIVSDLTTCYKLLNNKIDIDPNSFFLIT